MTHRSLAILPSVALLGYCGRVVMASRLGLWLIRDGKLREFESRQCQSFCVVAPDTIPPTTNSPSMCYIAN